MWKCTSYIGGIIALIVLSGCSFSFQPDRILKPDGTLRIGTWNVQDLFDAVDDPNKSDELASPPEKLEALAKIILETDCDILALQEVENINVLKDFNSDYLYGLYSDVILIEGNDPRGIDVAVLSKIPLSNVSTYRSRMIPDPGTGSTIRFSRDLVAVQWTDRNGRCWNLLTTHLKSGLDQSDRFRRTLQANEIARICGEDGYVTGFGKGLTILAGDLNAEPQTPDLEALHGVPFSDPARDLPYRYTHASGKVLDYILLSPDADRKYIIGSYTICRDSPAEKASDHYLVYLDLHI